MNAFLKITTALLISTSANANGVILDLNNECAEHLKVKCTREYMPTKCSANGMTVEGINRCNAKAKLKYSLCVEGLSLDYEPICKSKYPVIKKLKF